MIARLLLATSLLAAVLAAQTPAAEQQDLERALSAAGANALEYLRALENHLAKYPNTTRRAELEAAAARAAIAAGDDPAIVQYGERVLGRRPDDLPILEAVARSLAAANSRDEWERAVRYARRAQDLLLQQRNDVARRPRAATPELYDQLDRETEGVLLSEARATGNLGRSTDALALAGRAFETFPAAGAAREMAHWDEALGRPLDAARALADAVTVPDSRATLDDRVRDRARMDELYRYAKGSADGEGDVFLQAFDRNAALVHARQVRIRAADPNAGISDPMQFTIAALDGPKLNMATLKGKAIVLDFWATWCIPCREEHPLLDQVRLHFAGNADVVFLAIDTDEDRTLVKPFLDRFHWDDRVYFDDGLSRALSVMSLPSTLVIDRTGKVYSRMTGFSASGFVTTLTDRISAALK